jgi:hypothetical protein
LKFTIGVDILAGVMQTTNVLDSCIDYLSFSASAVFARKKMYVLGPVSYLHIL